MTHYKKSSLTGSGIPTSVVPEFIGQVYQDTYNNNPYISYGINTGEWSSVGSGIVNISHNLIEEIRFSSMTLQLTVGDKPSYGVNGVDGFLRFDRASQEATHGSFKIPDTYISGTGIDVEINYMNHAVQTGIKNCVWDIDYHVYSEGETFASKTATNISVTDALPSDAVAFTYQTVTSGISLSYNDSNNPLAAGKTVSFEFYRDGIDVSDTMELDADFLHMVFKIETEVGN